MDNIINKTKKLIDVIDSSTLIKNLDYYKNKVTSNKDIMNMIDKYNNSDDNYEKISIKKDIYKYEDYSLYMKYYNELFYIVMDINNRFKRYNDERGCH